MAVRWCEPFEDASALSVPGFSHSGGPGASFTSSNPRTGLGALLMASSTNRSATWVLSTILGAAGWSNFRVEVRS